MINPSHSHDGASYEIQYADGSFRWPRVDRGGVMETVSIKSSDFWVKVPEFLQHNWALIEADSEGGVCVYFLHDLSGVFDELSFASVDEAVAALRRNGFRHCASDEWMQSIHAPRPPDPPYHRSSHPNGPIYSSGRFWT